MNRKKKKIIKQITHLYQQSKHKCNGMIAFENYVYLNDGTPHYITGIDRNELTCKIICHVEEDVDYSLGWYLLHDYHLPILRQIAQELLKMPR